MKKTTLYLCWFTFVFICLMTLTISCKDNGGGSQQSSIEITKISPDSGRVGSTITIHSNGIDPKHKNNQIELNGIDVSILSYGSNSLRFKVPEGATSGPVTLKVKGKVANGPYFKVLTEAPQINAITPARGGPGTRVTITGSHFLPSSVMAKAATDTSQSPTQAKRDSLRSDTTDLTLKAKGEPGPDINGLPVSVSFGDQLAPLLSLSSNKIIAQVPEEANSNLIKLTVGAQSTTSDNFILLKKPAINKVMPTAGPVGTNVTISGHSFSPETDSNRVTFNGIPAEIMQADSTQLVATVPNKATTGPIEVITNGQIISGPTFSVTEAPVSQVTIDNITPKQGPVGTTVTIDGQNFSADKAENTVTFNGTEATIQSASETKLVAVVPEGTNSGSVNVSVGKQTAIGPSFSVTVDPEKQLSINNISPKEGPVGTSVTITGTNFSATASENVVTFNGTQATVSSASTTQLVADVPSGATSGPVTVKVGSQATTGPTFTVGDNTAPTITGEGSFSVEENTTTVTTITASDPDGDALTFSLSGGADPGQFNINKDSGELIFSTAPDFENPADVNADNSYEIEVKVTDGSVSVTKTITISVADIDEAPVLASTSLEADENSTQISTLDANDPEGSALTYNITGGDDAQALTLDQNSGKLTFNTAPNFESPADANTDNSYEAEITISDGSLSLTKILDITVQDVNEAPVITSAGPFTIEENTATVGTITATDPDGDALDFALLGGTKGTLTFSADASSGEITISPAPDFENPRDDNSDNTYELDISVSDGVLFTTQPVNITVTNVVEVPTINRGVIRPATTESYSLNSTNEEYIYRFDPVPAGTDLRSMSILNFSLGTSLTADLATSATVTGGADGGLFSVNSINTYAIHINGPSSLDYNHSADGNAHEYRFTITASNAGGTTPIYTIIIPVQNPFPQGSGTAADPYQVETIEQLQLVGQFLDTHFVQTTDIDASATAGWNGGQGFKPIGSVTNTFSGSYDGDGHTINGLTIDRPNTNFVGLFSRVSGTLEDIHVTGSSVSGNVKSGILAGRNDGNITNCSVSGEVYASGAQGSGGLVYSNTGTISGSYANVDVSASSSIFVGGLVGINFETISNSYATGGVSGDTYVGGLVGDNAGGSVDKSYATGMITGSGSNVGGLVGLSEGSATTTQSYWDTQTSGQASSDGGNGLTTSEMQGSAAETNMSGFDFGTVWQTNTGDYPTLRSNP